jgi:cold shock CspA family protein
MQEATVTFVSGKGWYFARLANDTAVFIHANNVENQRFLKVDDRVSLDLVPSPKKPNQQMGVNVKYLGHTIARQVSSSECSDERPNGQPDGRPYGQRSRS